MLHAIVVMREGASGVVRWVDEDTLHLASEFLLQGFQRQQVVAEDELVIKKVGAGDTVLGVVALLRIAQQNARPKHVSSSFCLLMVTAL